jgi:hypothetical protein
MMTIDALYLENDNLIILKGLKDSVAAGYLNTAAVQLTVLDPAGIEVDGANWPQTMDYVSASEGEYRYVLPLEVVLEDYILYTLKITVSAPLRGEFLKIVRAQGRYPVRT